MARGFDETARNGSGDGRRYEGSSPAPLPLTPSEDRQWATIAHFGAILGCIPSAVIYFVYRNRGPFAAQESKEALNFTFPPTVAAILANLLTLLPVVGGFFAVVAVAIWVFLTVSGVVAGIEVNRGRPYRYAFNLRLIK
ncbi:DUF4870 domain-containing protein [Zafaria sp. Z1313]|uniref:DUF4870 domain-containing protein n=1 Tax=unclassified Zafaria TaxID=2828765 RepID=UPI002E79D805|nr:DUF4870 domain-containing protein [Zafaria sp. J156]MEE1621154.1 DUF4870 domain-containing protein [Zafaria sp. J156]